MDSKIMKNAGFSKEIERLNKSECPICGEHVDESDFKDELSLKEFNISGMCRKCQDKIFN